MCAYFSLYFIFLSIQNNDIISVNVLILEHFEHKNARIFLDDHEFWRTEYLNTKKTSFGRTYFIAFLAHNTKQLVSIFFQVKQ